MTEDPRSSSPAHGSGRDYRGRTGLARDRIAQLEGHEDDFVAYFKERVYATFTGLALVLVLSGSAHPTGGRSLLVLALGVVGITAAGFVSDIISHLAVHQEFPRRRELGILLRIAGGALSTAIAPAILLGLAAFDVMDTGVALRISAIVYIVTLGVIGWFAVRRARLRLRNQLLALLLLVALGLGVVALQTLAHSVGEH